MPLSIVVPHFVQYVREIAYAIIPMPLDAREPYWINMARDFLSGAIVYYFDKGYDFIRTILLVQASPVADLCKEIMSGDCILAKTFISEISSLKREQQAAIGTDVKQHTMERSAWGAQVQEIRDPLIHPHEFSTNRDIWLHTPYGFLSTIKLPSIVTDQPIYKFDEVVAKYFRGYQE